MSDLSDMSEEGDFEEFPETRFTGHEDDSQELNKKEDSVLFP